MHALVQGAVRGRRILCMRIAKRHLHAPFYLLLAMLARQRCWNHRNAGHHGRWCAAAQGHACSAGPYGAHAVPCSVMLNLLICNAHACMAPWAGSRLLYDGNLLCIAVQAACLQAGILQEHHYIHPLYKFTSRAGALDCVRRAGAVPRGASARNHRYAVRPAGHPGDDHAAAGLQCAHPLRH